MRWGLVGDSQGVGLERPLAAVLERQGHTLASAKVQTGASLRTLAGLVAGVPRGLDLLVIVVGGGNDASASSNPARWLADVRALAEAARARAPGRLVWVGPMPARAGVPSAVYKLAARASMAAALAGSGVHWVDGFALAEGVTPRADGVHFDAGGYRAIAERAGPAILAAGGPSVLVVAGATLAGLAGVAVLAYVATRARR